MRFFDRMESATRRKADGFGPATPGADGRSLFFAAGNVLRALRHEFAGARRQHRRSGAIPLSRTDPSA